MRLNAAGLNVAGASNPNWKGGRLNRVCEACSSEFTVKRVHSSARFCSLQCVGVSQRGRSSGESRKVSKSCEVCHKPFLVYPAHADRQHCCGKACSHVRRSKIMAGEPNPNWNGGLSRLPYPWNFREISKSVIARDGGLCQGTECSGSDPRMTAHHIDYDKSNCDLSNLIALCSACNSKANFGRTRWERVYRELMARRQVTA